MPKVSVVILTRNRPEMIKRSVADALRQTLQDIEVIVVIDGPDEETRNVLGAIKDTRLRFVEHPVNMGISVARNTGFREARGEWVALQDDDDEWFPEKLEKQVEAGESLHGSHVFVMCRYIERTATHDNIRPEVMPSSSDTGKLFSEYMCCHRGMIVPCTVMVSRAFAKEFQFNPDIQPAEDNDYFMRCMTHPLAQLAAVPDVLAIYNNVTAPNQAYRMSHVGKWKNTLAWAIRQRSLFTGRAFAYYLVRMIAQMANNQGASFREKLSILFTALTLGSCTPAVVIHFLASSFLSVEKKHALRRLTSRRLRQGSQKVSPEPVGGKHA